MQASDTPTGPGYDSEGEGMRVDATLESTPTAPAEARRALAPLGRELPPDRLSDVQTVVSELVTNGVKYGPGRPIDVRVWLDDEIAVLGEVADHGQEDVRPPVPGDAAAGRGGLGLTIVDQIAESWGTRQGRSPVWFRVAL
jgi:anti-sigma regulatory factor (Ser/Thr protein kinase)